MMNKLTLVIPAKNESESLPKVLKELEYLKINTIVVIPSEDNLTKQSMMAVILHQLIKKRKLWRTPTDLP